ncbi:hypothetical protein [Sorangium sp. So ce128]|uniref:hypothetical protein n=1 Tax=Sorangium sp. So ce128 TaxID=3133281 RepID=UPI003F636AB9
MAPGAHRASLHALWLFHHEQQELVASTSAVRATALSDGGSNSRHRGSPTSLPSGTDSRMPGTPHEVLVVALRDRPALLADLFHHLTGCSLGGPTEVVDATVRFTRAIEVRPDLLLRSRQRGWLMVEVQNSIDERKRRSWPLAVSVLVHQEKAMGEVLVITASRRVASWAKRVAHLQGELGTRFELTPRVLLLAGRRVEALLDPMHPELALFAAWAVHHRRGPAARRIVIRALELTEKHLTDEPLRDAQARAILAVLSDAMLAALREMAMDPSKVPETPASRRFRLFFEKRGRAEGKIEGKIEGKREALLAVLEARGLSLTADERAHIDACRAPAELDRWIASAATAASMSEVFASKPASTTRRSPATMRSRAPDRGPRAQNATRPPKPGRSR